VDSILPYLFYTYGKSIEHDKNIFEKIFSGTFTFFTQDIHFDTHLYRFKLPTIPNQTIGLHHELLMNKYMIVELCARNDITSNGFVNGVNRIFEYYIKMSSNLFIWINFHLF